MAGGKVSAGCAGVGPGGAELLPADVDACAASSLWMSRAWLAHCCAADGRAQGLAAAGAAAGAGAGVDAEAAAPGAGAASPKGTAWGLWPGSPGLVQVPLGVLDEFQGALGILRVLFRLVTKHEVGMLEIKSCQLEQLCGSTVVPENLAESRAGSVHFPVLLRAGIFQQIQQDHRKSA